MSVLAKIYRQLLPEKARYGILRWRTANRLNNLKKKILRFYKTRPSSDPEINEALNFLKGNPLSVFPYTFSKSYDPATIDVFADDTSGLNYVMFRKHKLFFKRGLSLEQIRHAYSFLLCEQDPESPHCYLTGDFNIAGNSILADVGCAEGIFSLMNIDQLKQVYLFEADPDWIDALEQTFRPWKEKVTIVNKFVSDRTEGNFVSLDDYFKTAPVDFLKIDVDGAEDDLLKGSMRFIAGNRLKIALCTYHRQGDDRKFGGILEKLNFKINFSQNYMLFYFDEEFGPPYFRKALIRAAN